MNILQYADRISNDEYHARPNLSASGVKTLLQSPAHYRASQDNPTDSPAFRLGRMVHTAVLEPDEFMRTYATAFSEDRRTKQGKADWQTVIDAGLEPIKQSELDMCEGCRKAAGPLFPGGGYAELSFEAQIEGVMCQCRPDWLTVSENGHISLYDLKTCLSVCSADSTFYKYGYHVQQVFYNMVMNACLPAGLDVMPEMRFVFVEKSPPFDVVVRTMDMALWAAVEAQIRQAIRTYAKCTQIDVWPGVEPDRDMRQAVCPSYIESGLLPDLDMDGFYGADNAAC